MARKIKRIVRRKPNSETARNVLNVFVVLAIVALVVFGLVTSPSGINKITGAAITESPATLTGTFVGVAIIVVGLLLGIVHLKRNKVF